MWRSRFGSERSKGEAQWQRGLAGILLLLLYSSSEVVLCVGRVLEEKASSRSLLKFPPAPTPSRTSNDGPFEKYLWIIPSVISALLFCSISTCFYLQRRRRLSVKREIVYTKSPWKLGMTRTMRKRLKTVAVTELPTNTREELELECEEFSNIIGSSSDSVVFKGTRDSGCQIAVARVMIPPSRWNCNTELHFLRKVKDLARMKHANIVNLLAYCAEDEPFERMLVFEYTPNGTVHDHLHSSGSPADFLDWSTRMKIVMGAAYGLNYMHNTLDPPVTHIKFDSTSVSLTECYSAKIAAFGMAKLCVGSNSLGRRKSFSRIVQSLGYEDWDRYRHDPKLEQNVSCFGLFVLEMISGRYPYGSNGGSIISWANQYMDCKSKFWQLVDPSLASHNGEELVALVEIVKLCTEPKPIKRPTMVRVTEVLATALKMTPEDAALGSSGRIDYKSSPLMWAKLKLLSTEGQNGGDDEEEEQVEVVSSSTIPLLAGPSSPMISPKGVCRSPKSSSPKAGSKMTSPKGCSSSGDLPETRPLDEVAITITSSQVKQFQQSDSKSFER